MITRKEIKKIAKDSCKGNRLKFWLSAFVFSLIMNTVVSIMVVSPLMSGLVVALGSGAEGTEAIISALSSVGVMLPIASMVYTILMWSYNYGMTYVGMELYDGSYIEFKTLFYGLKKVFTAFGLNFLIGFFTTMWSFLFVIPGIVKSFAYSMTHYIKIENPEMGVLACITESKKMMKGHKMKLFVMSLSFLPWFLLMPFTFGLILFWLVPYMQSSMAGFYREVSNEFYGVADNRILLGAESNCEYENIDEFSDMD